MVHIPSFEHLVDGDRAAFRTWEDVLLSTVRTGMLAHPGMAPAEEEVVGADMTIDQLDVVITETEAELRYLQNLQGARQTAKRALEAIRDRNHS